jgi:hypothetical protein
MDEQRLVIAPNLAENQDLCEAVTKYITQEYWWNQLMLQEPFWATWQKIDNMWRSRFAAADLSIPNVTRKSMETVTPSAEDGKSARAQSVKPFQQMHAITDIGEQISWEGGLPARAEIPEDVIEGDFYQPTEQSCIAANAILRRSSEDINLRAKYRRSFGNFAKYGIAWAAVDFTMKYEEVELRFPLSAEPMEAEAQIQALVKAYPNAQFTQGMGFVKEQRVSELLTHFIPLTVDSVLIDPLISCDPVDNQPCPMVRQYIIEADLLKNRYDPLTNPFGFVNLEQAVSSQKGHYALTAEDEVPLRDRLKNRFNISDQMANQREQRIRQRWTAYPLLRISENGELDTGDGVTCPTCQGQKKIQQPVQQEAPMGAVDPGTMQVMADTQVAQVEEVDCPTCAGSGKARPPLKRWMVDFYGGMRMGATCIRIQEKPEKLDIPLLYAVDLSEDDACAYPMSKAEISMILVEQVTTAETQFHDSKEKTVYRGTKVKMDSPAAKIQNFNKPDLVAIFESDPREIERFDAGQFDETVTLVPYIERKEAQIEQIFGVTPTLQGLLASGRRSALEVGEATDAAKNPLVLMVDRYNRQMMGGWARKSIKNLELFGDRDYIRRVTGREFIGKVNIFTAVGEEFFKKLSAQQNIRYILESSTNDPVMQPARVEMWNELMKLMGINIRIPDGGMELAKLEAYKVVSEILGDGQFSPPEQDDPHQIYVEVFREAMRNDVWKKLAPQNMPLLQQRYMMQEQLAFQAEMMAMQEQALQQQIMNPQPNGDQPTTPGKPPQDRGQLNQAQQR